ncbi:MULTISPECIES: DUF1102 domain-containing protein [Halolamina]|uniref:DUF1102 domain-containing protein n=1 Tax=Halolamina pelagica TaxID=699431 RepID=A0A1I5PXK9_9EURY|nr:MULTISPECIES: DUF1102 domain-containing protein [Halolamina]NHX34982.1 DUF1102 domain-containing protein [Halolamina sp. R1-12]SFP38391.1 Protein of unknown function [Halolamina pelagica]
MERRKFIAGLGSITAAGAAGIGTGAFSATSAERSLSVEVADDASAYLSFGTDLGNSPDNNYEYASINDDELEIKFGSNDAGGQGVNPNSTNHFDDVFSITNQGTEPVEIWFTLSDDLDEYVDVYPIAGNFGRETSLVGESNAFSASWATGVGSGLRIGLTIDLSDADDVDEGDVLDGTMTVHAESI